MAKNFFQDMIKMKSDIRREMSVKVDVRSEPKVERELPREPLRQNKPQIKIKETLKEKESPSEPTTWAPVVQNKVARRVDVKIEEPKKKPRYSLWVVAGVSLVFLFFAVSFLFAEATIIISPKVQDVALNENFVATKDQSSGGGVSFDLISLPGEEIRMVEGGEIKEVSLPARGSVVIYNTYSTATQRLDINTRLEGSNGKMYKTVKQVTVPGMKGSTPGSVEVQIYGAEAGESYNSGPLDFQIFGFKGTPKYSKFYARSKDDIKGGFIGKQSTISEEQKASLSGEMRGALEAKLLKRAQDLIPEGFVLFPDAIALHIEGESFGLPADGASEVPFTLKGTLSGFLFDESELANKVAGETLAKFDGSNVFIANISDLKFTLLNQDAEGSEVKNISFNLSGNPKIVWKFDSEALKQEILGKDKDQFNEALSKYENVQGANVVLRPIWRRSFPEDASKLQVMVNYPGTNE